MKIYHLTIGISGKASHVRNIAKEVSKGKRNGILYKSNFIHYGFLKDNNLEAAEHSRDFMNEIIDLGGYIVYARLQLTNPNKDQTENYVSDWEFELNKGFHCDDEMNKINSQEIEKRLDQLNLKHMTN